MHGGKHILVWRCDTFCSWCGCEVKMFPPSFPPDWSTLGRCSAPASERPGLRVGPGGCWSAGPSDGLPQGSWWKPGNRWCCTSLRQPTTDPEPRCCNAVRDTQKTYQQLFKLKTQNYYSLSSKGILNVTMNQTRRVKKVKINLTHIFKTSFYILNSAQWQLTASKVRED